MKILFLIFFLIIKTTVAQPNLVSTLSRYCSTDFDCGQGICDETISKKNFSCVCDHGWTQSRNARNKTCEYHQKPKLVAFILSFFLGGLGADWYYLSVGNGGYIAAGVFKMLTLGGIGIWWLVDWIRILTNAFLDGQGYALSEWFP
jgi:hypothetical protein